jgi:hypothetical protein
VKEKNPKGTPKTLMPPIGVHKPNGGKKPTLKETKQHICKVELKGLPNLIGKKNDENPKIHLK